MRYVSAVPAYGRDYTTPEAVLADWKAGKDFLTQDLIVHGYVNKDDLPPDTILNIRYDRLREVLPVGPVNTAPDADEWDDPFTDVPDDLPDDEGDAYPERGVDLLELPPDPRGTGPDRYPNAYFDGDSDYLN